jgi:hypothetical protein
MELSSSSLEVCISNLTSKFESHDLVLRSFHFPVFKNPITEHRHLAKRNNTNEKFPALKTHMHSNITH